MEPVLPYILEEWISKNIPAKYCTDPPGTDYTEINYLRGLQRHYRFSVLCFLRFAEEGAAAYPFLKEKAVIPANYFNCYTFPVSLECRWDVFRFVGKTSGIFLGDQVSTEGTHSLPDCIAERQNSPVPITALDLPRFLGMVNSYPHFLPPAEKYQT
ncbi:hypothetical protein TNCV_4713921 [Trichonephila clavipes]|nr:hypothetical protein TNCV_4713921 [Trichonephila clavipes]